MITRAAILDYGLDIFQELQGEQTSKLGIRKEMKLTKNTDFCLIRIFLFRYLNIKMFYSIKFISMWYYASVSS